MIKKSFPPIIGKDPKILILGSLPGDLSIKLNQYYAHPRNRFWPIIFKIYNQEFSEDYIKRVNIIQQNHLILWDVLNSAKRVGSMDHNIKDATANRIKKLLEKYKSVERVIFNGKKSEQLFNQNFDKDSSIEYITLPSTSPANATYNIDKLIDSWKSALIL